MHSAIGNCNLKQGNLDQACADYKNSLELAEQAKSIDDQAFAAAGLLKCACKSGDPQAAQNAAEKLLELDFSKDLAEDLEEALECCQDHGAAPWYGALQARLTAITR